MKLSPKFRTKKMGMINTILGSFCYFFNWEGANIWPDIQPQIRHRKISGDGVFLVTTCTCILQEIKHDRPTMVQNSFD